ncbi:M20/M25/M40 family metallo-hydrolase [Mycobacterium yunnanensis]|uniref:M20/M25/M40 family metallo-hydrolase n=1 Tax=Mycobacterium yunnanensis TaxID=368477 RepID=A0A9X2YYM6_9MYCO|nr:M20/M25/M40 family metallo-hydrolase [Mycobacterium yunnanensis]MCV7420509.1 M20/M25/M40 family metallo-hydrolase [Mycobacterium yunnanensis]
MTSAFAAALTRVEGSVLDLTGRLVRCPSITSDTAAVESALTELSSYLADSGIEVDVSRSAAGAPMLRARVSGPGEGVNILLQGHVDVVPVDEGWQRDPFGADVDGGYLYGRGTCDMKAGLAGFAGVLRALQSCGGPRRGSVTLLVDADEETGSDSGLIPYIAKHGLSEYDWAICGEPTGLQPFLGNRGLLWVSVTVRGCAAHAGIPGAGLNPVPVAAELVTDLGAKGERAEQTPTESNPLTITTFHAGTVPNSIADTAVFTIDRRLQPGDSADAIIDDLRAAVARAAQRHPSFEFGLDVVKRWPPCLLDENSDLAQAAYHAADSITGHASFGFDEACNDASFLSEAGVPTIIWGPGDPALAHTSDERVLLDDITRAMHGYGRAVETLLSVT